MHSCINEVQSETYFKPNHVWAKHGKVGKLDTLTKQAHVELDSNFNIISPGTLKSQPLMLVEL